MTADTDADTEIPLMSVAQLATWLGVGKATVYRGCRETDPDKRWPHETVAGKFKFTASQRRRILALLSTGDGTPPETAVADAIPLDRLLHSMRRLAA